jgi:hypothetical protein
MTSISSQKITAKHPVVHSIKQLYCPYWDCKRWATWLKGKSIPHIELLVFYKKGKQPPIALLVPGNPANFTISNLNETGWKVEKKFDILINGERTDPGTLLYFQLIIITHENSSYQVFHSFYEEIQSEFPISLTTPNLFLSLSESITQTLSITLSYVCGRTNMGDHWP